jgi:hypothetical protein
MSTTQDRRPWSPEGTADSAAATDIGATLRRDPNRGTTAIRSKRLVENMPLMKTSPREAIFMDMLFMEKLFMEPVMILIFRC